MFENYHCNQLSGVQNKCTQTISNADFIYFIYLFCTSKHNGQYPLVHFVYCVCVSCELSLVCGIDLKFLGSLLLFNASNQVIE